MLKRSKLSQIPGMRYGRLPISTLPKPSEWTSKTMEPEVIASQVLELRGEIMVHGAEDPELQHITSRRNPFWRHFTDYCEEHRILRKE